MSAHDHSLCFSTDDCQRAELGNQLEAALKKHDWHYHYSDSMRVVDSGERSEKAIKKMVAELGDEGKVIYNSIAPDQYKI